MTDRTTISTACVLGFALLLGSVLVGCGDGTADDAATESTTQEASGEPATTDQDEPVDSVDASSVPADEVAAVTPLTDGDRLSDYTLADDAFGTMTTVTVTDTTRTIATNALPDHETGEFPNSGNPNTISAQDQTWEFPTQPTFVGDQTWAMVPGVAVNGVKFEPETAESVTCATGESYRVEALQDTYDLGFDFNNAHVQPTGEYHYHGVSQLLAETAGSGDDLVHVGFAADGYLIYYSMSGAYVPSWELSTEPRSGTDCLGSGALGGAAVEVDGTAPDGVYVSDWVFDETLGDLDECNGTTIDGQYAYLITIEYPFVSRCLNGEVTGGGAPGGGQGAPPAEGGAAPGGAPDLADAAATLGVTVEQLEQALGDPPPDLSSAAEALAIPVEELEAALPPPPN